MSAPTFQSRLARLWQRAKAIQHAVAVAITVALLFVVYFTVVAVVAVVARLLGKDLLHPRPPLAGSHWIAREPVTPRLEDLARQF